MQAYMAGIPYVEGFKKKLESIATAEGFYEYTMYLVCSMLNVYARTQVKVWSSESRQACLNGRVVTIFHTWDLSTPVATPQTYECRIARPRSTETDILPTFYIDRSAANNVDVKWEIYASNLVQPCVGTLHLVVKKEC
jgi:hypothetical protein